MSDLVRQRPEAEDLSALVRRGHASRADERALESALGRDPTLRVAHQVGLDLDRDTSVRAGDEELILRAADAALTHMGPTAVERTKPARAWSMAAAVVLGCVLSCSGIGARYGSQASRRGNHPGAPSRARGRNRLAARRRRWTGSRASIPARPGSRSRSPRATTGCSSTATTSGRRTSRAARRTSRWDRCSGSASPAMRTTARAAT